MKKIWDKLIALISIALLCISGCTAHDPDFVDNDEEINTTQVIDTSATDTPAVDTTATDTSAIDTPQLETIDNYDFGTPVAGIDLNYDGIPEDFFIGKDEYGDDEYIIVMYDNEKGTFDDIDISRTETLDLYRENYAAPDEPPDYRYWFTYVWGLGINKSIHYSNIYTGCENEKALVGTHYVYNKQLAPRISYYLTDEKGFDELMTDPHTFFEKHRDFEFVESISLEERINADCKQAYLSSIKVADEMPEIEIYSLENDVFGKKYKFTNGKYSYFTDAFNDVEIYERYADLAVPTNEYNHFDIVPRGEKDYLICLKNSNQEAVVFLYLGTASEGYLFQYGADRNQYKSYTENPEHYYKTYLKDDGWLFVKQIEIVNDEKQDYFQSHVMNGFYAEHDNIIIDTLQYDIDGDGSEEFLILSEGSLLHSNRELHCYKEEDNSVLYCGAVELKSELNDDIYDPNTVFSPLESISISKMDINGESRNVMGYSVYSSAAQYNYVSQILLKNHQLSLKPVLMWGIDKNYNYSGLLTEKEQHIFYFDGDSQREISQTGLESYLSDKVGLHAPPFRSRTIEKLDSEWSESDVSIAWHMIDGAPDIYAEYTDRLFCDIDNDLSAELLLTSYSTQNMYFFKKTDDKVELIFEHIDMDVTNGYMLIPPIDEETIQKCEFYDYQNSHAFKLYNKSGDIYISGISWRPAVGKTCWVKKLNVSNGSISFCDVFRWGMFTENERIASEFEYRKYDDSGNYSYTTRREIYDFLLFLDNRQRRWVCTFNTIPEGALLPHSAAIAAEHLKSSLATF